MCVGPDDDDLRIYRFGFDPEKNFEEDGLHFTDNRNDPSNPRQIRLALWEQMPVYLTMVNLARIQSSTHTRRVD